MENKKYETMRTQDNKEWLNSLEGNEIWTNCLHRRGMGRSCVSIDKGNLVCDGKTISPTNKEIEELMLDHSMQEYGTTNFEDIMKMEGF